MAEAPPIEPPLPILVLGVSMGGASAILAQANHPSKRVCALITVGAYDAIENVFKNVATSSGLAWGWTRPIFRLAGVIAGFDLQTCRPVDHVAKLSVPFIAKIGRASCREGVEIWGCVG